MAFEIWHICRIWSVNWTATDTSHYTYNIFCIAINDFMLWCNVFRSLNPGHTFIQNTNATRSVSTSAQFIDDNHSFMRNIYWFDPRVLHLLG